MTNVLSPSRERAQRMSSSGWSVFVMSRSIVRAERCQKITFWIRISSLFVECVADESMQQGFQQSREKSQHSH